MPTRSVDTLAQEVLNLPPTQRALLVDRVVASLDADCRRDAAWDALAARREAELQSGLVQALPLDEVLTRLDARSA